MATSRKTARPSAKVHIRMYRHGLGDCFLLRFPKEDGKTFNILIDCGLITVAKQPRERLAPVLDDLEQVTEGRLDVVVLTHEHWDHVSGFSEAQARARFDVFEIGEAWYAWTEDPANKLGKKLRDERAAKAEALRKAAFALDAASKNPERIAADAAAARSAGERAGRVAGLLRFFGVDGIDEVAAAGLGAAAAAPVIGKTRAAFDYLRRRQDVATRFLRPKDDPLPLPGVPNVRVFALGPPEDEGLIKRSRPTKAGREVYEFAGDLGMDGNLAAAFDRLAADGADNGVDDGPFEQGLRLHPAQLSPASNLPALMDETWSRTGRDWRRIDLDWTTQAEALALDLDNHTNNTCLVLAFELSPGGKVLLFPGDAQVGNWLSWQSAAWSVQDAGGRRQVSGPQLLDRTVFYKVGHHGSHNATLREFGLEQMRSRDLVAFVPVFKDEAEKSGWHEMPFEPLVERLQQRTARRVVFSDPKLASAGEFKTPAGELKQEPLYVEYSLELT